MAKGRPEAPSALITHEVIVAIATPPGAGAIGLLRLSGPDASRLALNFLKTPSLPDRRPVLCRAFDAEGDIDGVLATKFPRGASYTGEETVEVSSHGSPYILRRLLDAAISAGARQALPGEFTQRAYLAGRMDLAQAEAVCAVISARTQAAHRAALSQLDGGLSKKVNALRGDVLAVLARLEAAIDHPDDDLPDLDPRSLADSLAQAAEGVRSLAAGADRARLLSGQARVAILGRPNAGKSSLLNALVGAERAIVSSESGTTRDLIEAPADLCGVEALLIDTAGLRDDAESPVERAGIERARSAAAGADLALAVFDRTHPADPELLAQAGRAGAVLCVLTKADLSPARLSPAAFADAVEVSAVTGQGIEALAKRVAALLAGGERGEALAASARHRAALARAGEELRESMNMLKTQARDLELCAPRLRGALDALGDIVGETTTDDILAEIFARFCVGK